MVAMSSGWPMRPSGVSSTAFFWKSLPIMPAAWTPSVSTMPGLSELTRIFLEPSSLESETLIESTAPLVPL